MGSSTVEIMSISVVMAKINKLRESALEQARRFESRFGGVSSYREDIDLYDAIISALRKRVPAKPHNATGHVGRCPTCRYPFDEAGVRYCVRCGQRIDWGDDET